MSGCSWLSSGQNSDGVRMFQNGQYQAAVQRFQQSIATHPTNPDGYYNLAATYHRLGKLSKRQQDLDQAENYYNQCLDYDPDHRDCYRGLAVLLMEQGRGEESLRLLEGWAIKNPSAAAPRVEQARLLEELGRPDAAKEHLLEALANDPYDARALAALGRMHERAGNQAQALADYQRSLWHDRFQPEVAARVSSLRTALGPSPAVTPPGGTRTVVTPGTSLR